MKTSKKLNFELDYDTEIDEVPFNENGELFEIVICTKRIDRFGEIENVGDEYPQGFYTNESDAKFEASIEEDYADAEHTVEVRVYNPSDWDEREHYFTSYDIR